jgi:hypothetical protein
MTWASFSADEVAALTRGESFFVAPAERVCPACGRSRLRAYVTSPPAARRPTRVSYAWCGACDKFVGTRSKHPEGLVCSDPLALLSDPERRDQERTLTGFLTHLDHLWDSGVLPQTFAA